MLSVLTAIGFACASALAGEASWSRESVPARPLERPLLLRAGWAEPQFAVTAHRWRGGFTANGRRTTTIVPPTGMSSTVSARVGATDWLELAGHVSYQTLRTTADRRSGFVKPELSMRLRLFESVLPSASMAVQLGWRPALHSDRAQPTPDAVGGPSLREGAHHVRPAVLLRGRTGPFRLDSVVFAVVCVAGQAGGWRPGDGVGASQDVLLQAGPASFSTGVQGAWWSGDQSLGIRQAGGWDVAVRFGVGLALNRVLDVEVSSVTRVWGRPTWWTTNPSVSTPWGPEWTVAATWRH